MSNNRNINKYAEMFKALSNPHRLDIFMRLASCCVAREPCCSDDEASMCVGELGGELGIGASTVSHHLKELRNSGLIRMSRNGQKIECMVEPGLLEEMSGFFQKSK